MKKKSMQRPLKQSGDSKKMCEVIEWAQRHDLDIYRTTDHCVQIEGVNFWPDKGTIQEADRKRHSEKGLEALARLLRKPPPSAPPPLTMPLG